MSLGIDRKKIIAIDASRNRSGGAKAHIIGVLESINPIDYGVTEIHVWAYKDLASAIPRKPWLFIHTPNVLEKSIFHQLYWQYRKFPQELKEIGCDVLLTTDAGSVCTFLPSVVMSRDMLSFESGEMKRFGFSLARLRLFLLKWIQIRSLKRASGALFLTDYASSVLQRYTGKLSNFRIIPHGIGENFRLGSPTSEWGPGMSEIRCLYVSNLDMYKHQWHVVRAIAKLRSAGYPVVLELVGGGHGRAKLLLDEAILDVDATGSFVKLVDFAPHSEIPRYLSEADIFVFASSCENMPNTLVEAMAAGLPIACSNRGPMPQILADGGVYFDPENSNEIAESIETLISNADLRKQLASKAKLLSEQYSWRRCGDETMKYLVDIANDTKMADSIKLA